MIHMVNNRDNDGNPAGGVAKAIGVDIEWQNGPLRLLRLDGDVRDRNGAFVEDVIEIAKSRLEFYQRTKFKCEYNDAAIACLEAALATLARRTADREQRGVEGTYEV